MRRIITLLSLPFFFFFVFAGSCHRPLMEMYPVHLPGTVWNADFDIDAYHGGGRRTVRLIFSDRMQEHGYEHELYVVTYHNGHLETFSEPISYSYNLVELFFDYNQQRVSILAHNNEFYTTCERSIAALFGNIQSIEAVSFDNVTHSVHYDYKLSGTVWSGDVVEENGTTHTVEMVHKSLSFGRHSLQSACVAPDADYSGMTCFTYKDLRGTYCDAHLSAQRDFYVVGPYLFLPNLDGGMTGSRLSLAEGKSPCSAVAPVSLSGTEWLCENSEDSFTVHFEDAHSVVFTRNIAGDSSSPVVSRDTYTYADGRVSFGMVSIVAEVYGDKMLSLEKYGSALFTRSK